MIAGIADGGLLISEKLQNVLSNFMDENMVDLMNYGFMQDMIPLNCKGIPARITAVHKERYALICEWGEIYGRLKSNVYYGDTSMEYPTIGDFVMINYNSIGDSQIIRTLH